MTKLAAFPNLTAGTRRSGPSLYEDLQARLQQVERDYLNEKDRRAICARCKEARVKAGLNEIEMGELLSPPVRDRTIRNYETFRPPLKVLRQWADITRVSYDWLLRGDEAAPAALSRSDYEVRALSEEIRQMRLDLAALQASAGAALEGQQRILRLLSRAVGDDLQEHEEAAPGP